MNPGLKVIIYEKASTIGGHLVSGTVLQRTEYIKYISEYSINSCALIKEENLWLLNKDSCLNLIKYTSKENKE